jgi:hypothetical protein
MNRCHSPRLLLLIAILSATCSLAAQDKNDRNVWMGRFSAVEGEVSYRRAADAEQYWFDAAVNTPLGENDQVFTSRAGRAEIQLTGRNIVRLDCDTSFKITQFTTDLTQVSLQLGTATFRVDSLDRRQFQLVDARDLANNDPLYFEINTPTVAVTLVKEGVYRVTVREDGTTEVVTQRGEAEVYNRELGTIALRQGRRIVVEGDDPSYYQIARARERDEWDAWGERRDAEIARRIEESLSARHVPVGVPGVYDLDRHGDWYDTPEYGQVWSPRVSVAGWAPYRYGYWNWYPGYGWTWVSSEVWGWAPYHYGRWAYLRNRWCWVPRGSFTVGFSWSPALVTFFGSGGRGYDRGYRDGRVDGYRQGYRDGAYDWVGWVPLAPGERYHGHWRRGGSDRTITDDYPGSTRLSDHRNYSAPGGVTGLDGRRFSTGRVVVSHNTANSVTPPGGSVSARSAVSLRGDVFRPVERVPQPEPTSRSISPAVTRAATARVITRRAEPGGSPTQPGRLEQPRRSGDTLRSIDGGVPTLRDAGTVRDNEGRRGNEPGRRAIVGRENPADGGVSVPHDGDANRRTVEPPRRAVERPIERPVERPIAPSRSGDGDPNEPRRIERPAPRVFGRDAEPARPAPRENPSSEPRRVEPVERPERPERREPIQRRVEPSESPRPEPRPERRPESRYEPRYEPRPEPRPERPSAPPRESAPRRDAQPERYERPAPPPRQIERQPAPRPEAPPRQVERPSAPVEGRRGPVGRGVQ